MSHTFTALGGGQVVNVPCYDPGLAAAGTIGAGAGTGDLLGPQLTAGASAAAMVSEAAAAAKGTAGVDGVRLAGAAKCKVYVCFEGPFGC